MPDWTYQPILKPLLFRLPPRMARDLTLSISGGLANLPMGTRILDFMGDMEPHQALALEQAGMFFAGRVGLEAGLVFDKGAILAFSRFGLGHIEIGPVTVSPVVPVQNAIIRDDVSNSISYASIPENPGSIVVAKTLEEVNSALKKKRGRAVRIGTRISSLPGQSLENAITEYRELSRALSVYADFITIDTRWWQDSWSEVEFVQLIIAAKEESKLKPIFILLPPDCPNARVDEVAKLARDGLVDGVVVGGGMRVSPGNSEEQSQQADSLRVFGRPCKESAIVLTKRISSAVPNKPIIASGGIIEPQDALDFFDAGASLIQLHSGVVFSGPGLAKRINECLAYRRADLLATANNTNVSGNVLNQGWIGFTLVSTGLIIAGIAVICVGLTSVLLPYDEAFLGVARNDIPGINANLLKFMSHDRVTLGGTSLSGAVLFFGLAAFGVRKRMKWAYVAEVAGITAGFLAFFLYLGFKYFDPLHALVCILVLPFFIWGILRKPVYIPEQSSNLFNSKVWKRSQLGQLMFVSIGFGLLLAGITIAGVGCSTIFVKEDLLFMCTTRESLAGHHHLLPLIAHDRASFGGCLWAVGTVEMLTSLYGFRQGNRWVWWTLFLGGLPGFLAVLGIHLAIGYTHFVHLFPAYIAVAMYLIGLYCSYDYLCKD